MQSAGCGCLEVGQTELHVGYVTMPAKRKENAMEVGVYKHVKTRTTRLYARLTVALHAHCIVGRIYVSTYIA